MRIHYYQKDENSNPVGGYSISHIKKMIKEQGGFGFTLHIERDGTVFDSTEITLKGNNSRFKYNRHL